MGTSLKLVSQSVFNSLKPCFVFRGESPGCRLFSTASVFEWLINLLPHHSQGSNTEIWSQNTLRVVTVRVFYVLGGSLTTPLFLIIQCRLQRHLTWSDTHTVVSWEIDLWNRPKILIEKCVFFLCISVCGVISQKFEGGIKNERIWFCACNGKFTFIT